MKTLVLYNPLSGNRKGEERARNLITSLINKEITLIDVTQIDIKQFFAEINEEDEVILCGGDGTINHFVNDIDGIEIKNPVYFYPAGSGNDFFNDIGMSDTKEPVLVNKYLSNLPYVIVNGMKRRFINGIGFGIDGYCCEVADKMRAKDSNAKIDYTAIAIKGLLFGFDRPNAEIEYDGKTLKLDYVWLAGTMKGRYYGGGMNAAPHQDRLDSERLVSLTVMHAKSKIKTLMLFPKIFEGKHILKPEIAREFKAHDVKVKFDRPTALQIDGETVLAVTEYEVHID